MATPLSALQTRYFEAAVAACRANHQDHDLSVAAALAALDLEEAEGREAYDVAAYRVVALMVDHHMAHRNAPPAARPLVVACDTCGEPAPEASDDPNGECAGCAFERSLDDAENAAIRADYHAEAAGLNHSRFDHDPRI